MTEIHETGGARIGMANASWPLATLKVGKDYLKLSSFLTGKLTFEPEQLISIAPYSGLMSRGIKINHNVSEYKKHVVFWTFGDVNKLIEKIEEIGFL